MKFNVFHLQFPRTDAYNSLEGLGMFFCSAVLIRRHRRYTATPSAWNLGFLAKILDFWRKFKLLATCSWQYSWFSR